MSLFLNHTHRDPIPFAFFDAFAPLLGFDRESREQVQTSFQTSFRVVDHENETTLVADLPGVSAKDLEVTLEGRTLSIQANAKVELPEGYRAQRRERTSYSFSKKFTVSNEIDGAAVTAAIKDGVLTIRLPKRPASEPVKITVQTT